MGFYIKINNALIQCHYLEKMFGGSICKTGHTRVNETIHTYSSISFQAKALEYYICTLKICKTLLLIFFPLKRWFRYFVYM